MLPFTSNLTNIFDLEKSYKYRSGNSIEQRDEKWTTTIRNV